MEIEPVYVPILGYNKNYLRVKGTSEYVMGHAVIVDIPFTRVKLAGREIITTSWN